jgi:aspartyl-tRNA(Asn)/glutamyl-tRNA(Gln) amidotransferase subunit A
MNLLNSLIEKIKSYNVSNVYTIKKCFKNIKKINPKVNAFIRLNEKKSLKRANKFDKIEKRYKLNNKVLIGIPIGIKDNIMIKDELVTSGSKYFKDYISPYDATVIKKLKNSGAIFVGQTNMDEFAMGGSTETSIYKKTKNPWNLEYIPGGSSGGSAVAVSSGMVPIALGSDTGGSVRQPASFCGIVGYKPSYGLISRYGVCALASSFDQIGIFSKTVFDSAILMNVISGIDKKDQICESINNMDYTYHLTKNKTFKKIKIGIPKQLYDYKIDSEIFKSFNNAIDKLKLKNISIYDIDIPFYKYISSIYKIIMCAEVSANIATFDGIRYGHKASNINNLYDEYSKTRAESFGYEVKKRILFGTYVLESKNYDKYYNTAQKARTILIKQINDAYKKCDFIFSPSTLQMPIKFGKSLSDECDIFLIAANLAGLPGITIPYSISSFSKIPIGMHFMGKRFSDAKLFKMAYEFEKIANFKKEYPKF